MTVTDAPKIITSRFEQADAHTLAGYRRTHGYDGLTAALRKTPQQVADEVKAASLLGRGGFPGRRQVDPRAGRRVAPLPRGQR